MAAFILLTPSEGDALFPDLPDSQLEQCGAAWCGDSTASVNNTNLYPPDVSKVHKVLISSSCMEDINSNVNLSMACLYGLDILNHGHCHIAQKTPDGHIGFTIGLWVISYLPPPRPRTMVTDKTDMGDTLQPTPFLISSPSSQVWRKRIDVGSLSQLRDYPECQMDVGGLLTNNLVTCLTRIGEEDRLWSSIQKLHQARN